MLRVILIAAFFCLAVVHASELVKLTPKNFDEVVQDESKHVFIKFFAPWCGHCQKMAPEWDKLAAANSDPDTIIAEFNADKYRAKVAELDLHAFPHMRLYNKANKVVDFNGERTAEGFKSFLEANK